MTSVHSSFKNIFEEGEFEEWNNAETYAMRVYLLHMYLVQDMNEEYKWFKQME